MSTADLIAVSQIKARIAGHTADLMRSVRVLAHAEEAESKALCAFMAISKGRRVGSARSFQRASLIARSHRAEHAEKQCVLLQAQLDLAAALERAGL